MTFELLATSLFGTLLAVAVTKTASSLHSQKKKKKTEHFNFDDAHSEHVNL
jgi:mannose/fructose/N-acetylgalactosamine-specific phosphotransferase system component IIC